jgi:guanidinoacetate N-methyltransferase
MSSETGYHGLRAVQYGGNKNQWQSIAADYHELEGHGEVLVIDGHPVMEEWEKPYMRELARVAARGGGKVLEVGFGLGLSASAIQEQRIQEHIIIEANHGVIQRGEEWAKRQPNPVTFLEGLWQDVVDRLEDNSVDAILYDTYPLTKEEQHTHQFDFIKKAFRVLKPGGVLVYCNLTSIGVLLGEHDGDWESLWWETQVPHIEACGFERFAYHTFPVEPPDTCGYYAGHEEALVPRLVKPSGSWWWSKMPFCGH